MNDGTVARVDRRRRRRASLLLVVTVVSLAVAAGCIVAAFVVRRDTADLQARAEPIDRRVHELTASEKDAVRRLRVLRTQSRATAAALVALLDAYRAQVDASNHAVDVSNQAVDQYNDGQAGVAAAFQGAGDAAIAEVELRTTAVHTAVDTAVSAISRLMASGG
jgi:hypothetical protein